MKIRRILAIAYKEWLHVQRDWRSLLMALGAPIFLLVLFGYALTLDVKNVSLIVLDQSQTPYSRDYVSSFTSSDYFTLTRYVDRIEEVEAALDRREAFAGLIIPVNYAEKLHAGKIAPVQLLIDGSDSNTATITLGYAEAITAGYSNALLMEELKRDGINPPNIPLDMRSRVWYNPNTDTKYSIVPGLIAVIMMVIAAMLTSLTIAREWERGTMEQLISTPVKVPELIMGKILPYFLIGLFDVILIVTVGEILFQVPLKGSLILLFVMTLIFLIGSLSLGIVISIVTKTQLLASQLAMVSTFLPSFLLSGFLSTISNMPTGIQMMSYVVPARYFITLLRSLYLKGAGLTILFWEALFLTCFALVMVILAHLKFKKKLA